MNLPKNFINQIIQGNALAELKKMPNESVDCIICSPPYWALRDYQTELQIWDGDETCKHNFTIEASPRRQRSTKDIKDLNSKEATKPASAFNARKTNFCSYCSAWKGSLGLEPTFELYIKHLCDIFDEVKRVLKESGTCWVVIGDTYSGSGCGTNDYRTEASRSFQARGKRAELYKTGGLAQKITDIVLAKSLVMIPFRFAIQMVDRGWILRNTIIWKKDNCMPSSVKDRFTVDFEYIFFFTKNRKYYFEQQLEPWTDKNENDRNRALFGHKKYDGKWKTTQNKGSFALSESKIVGDPLKGRNKRCVWNIEEPVAIVGELAKRINDFKDAHPEIDTGWFDDIIDAIYDDRNTSTVWRINTVPFRDAHFAVFPLQLVEPMIKAGCPEFICTKCGKPRVKVYKPAVRFKRASTDTKYDRKKDTAGRLAEKRQAYRSIGYESPPPPRFVGWTDCSCSDNRNKWQPGIVLDPFSGAGTTCKVAQDLNRWFIGIELNPEYIKIAKRRIGQQVLQFSK